MSENPDPSSSDNVPDTGSATVNTAPKRSLTELLRAYGGWLIWIVLLMATLTGLAIAVFSASDQIQDRYPDAITVPRRVVAPPAQSSVWPERNMTPTVQLVLSQTPYTQPMPPTSVQTPATTPVPLPATAKVAPVSPLPVKAFPDRHLANFDRPVIAIVIDDMGLDRRHSLQMIQMDAPVTLAFMPYAPQVETLAQQARGKGHELIVHMPMEPENLASNNPGPDALLLKNGAVENVRRFDKNLTAFNGYMGINNHMGSAFTASRADMVPILMDLKQRGLWFLDSKTNAQSVAASVADEIGLPFASRDVFLDNVNSKAAVLAQLKQTEAIARHKGYAIAIGHPKEGTVQGLQTWMADAQNRGFTLVPLSTIIQARFPKAPLPQYARAVETKLARNQIAPVEEEKSNW